jgi:rhodanese-related sulfurtransferase
VQALTEAGFTNVVNLQAGIEGWRGAGMPTVKS